MKDIEYYQQQSEFHLFVANTYPSLVQLKKEENQTAFNTLLVKVLPDVKRYIGRRLHAAITMGKIPRGKYKPDDFIDQLFIETYEHFDEVQNEKNLHPWLFKKADQLLEDTMVDEEFDDFFFKNVDDYSQPEWDEMEEKFSTDADGDLVMFEDLDDESLNKTNYTLNHVFVEDNERETVDKLDQELSEERIQNHINLVLNRLPLSMQTVFELFNQQQFTLEEIATIKNITVPEVEQLLEDARKSLKTSFYNRFL